MLDRPPNWIGIDSNGQSGLLKRSSVPTCPPSKTRTPPESGTGQEKTLQTTHTPDTNYSSSSPLVDAHCLLDRSLFAKTSRHKNSFFPLAVSLLNSSPTVAYIFIPALLALSTSSLHYCCVTFHSYCI